MHGIAMLTLGCLWPMFSLVLDRDMEELHYRMFSMPIQIKEDGKGRAPRKGDFLFQRMRVNPGSM